jgi:type I restriction enzyme M protein
MEHLRKKYTSKEGRIVEKYDGEQHVTYTGDLLEPYRQHIQSGMFHGFDFDVTMLRIAAMNLMLHGVDTPDIHYQDTLSNNFPDRFPNYSSECFDLILANPPFKGSLDEQDVHSSLTGKVKTKKTELLFLILMLRMLKLGGRCAVIVPDGVLFGSSNAHVAARKLLVEEHQLEAVVKLPAGVFKPYAGVSTAILIFTKGGRTTDVWFYDVQADGYSLDDKRDPVEANDLPDVCARWAKRNPKKDTDRKDKAFFVPKAEIAENKYDLSLNRYKEIVHEEVKYDSPKKILARLEKLEAEIANDLAELEAMLG